MIGMSVTFVHLPVISPVNKRDIMTVNKGDELFTVSTNDIVEYFNATRPNKIDVSLLKR
jgi:hypothetical protein